MGGRQRGRGGGESGPAQSQVPCAAHPVEAEEPGQMRLVSLQQYGNMLSDNLVTHQISACEAFRDCGSRNKGATRKSVRGFLHHARGAWTCYLVVEQGELGSLMHCSSTATKFVSMT
ncbi:unnamed protein product [Prorocentrum cordatum]|uniref:Uncharacterized protein n=1 Tax=Prorocentrum cordatum TaxID=2364126 RepID=A0ABN9TL47_9DINO|nr:unnamed protein product [Polarella glacialis]